MFSMVDQSLGVFIFVMTEKVGPTRITAYAL